MAASVPDRVRGERRVAGDGRGLSSDGVTHEELRALLASYAAGALDDERSAAVRTHLAGGCLACLDELFGHPVGLPRAVVPDSPSPGRPSPGSQLGLLVAVVGVSLAFAAAVGWMIVERGAGERVARRKAARVARRLAEAEIARARLATRLDAVEREAAAAREDASRQAEATREVAEERTQLGEDLAAARERIATFSRALARRDAELARLRLGLDGQDALHQVAGTPGADLLHLHPVPPFHNARGHALWSPSTDTLVLYAFNLPSVATAQTYRTRLTVDQGREVTGPSLTVHHNDATTVIHLDATARLEAIDVLLDPPTTPVLSWRRPGG